MTLVEKVSTSLLTLLELTISKRTKNLDAAASDCRVVLLWILDGGKVPEADISPILFKRIRIEGSTLGSRDEECQGELRDKLESYLPEFQSGQAEGGR